jgi:hypothetical protein
MALQTSLAEFLAQQDSVVLQIGLQLSDNIPAAWGWTDSVSFLLPATTVATAGQQSQALFSEGLRMHVGEQVLVSLNILPLNLSDQLVMQDGSGFGTGPFGSIPFGSGAVGDLIGFGILLSDSLTMSDVAPTIIGEYDLALACMHLGAHWADNLTALIQLGLTDSLTMTDSFNSFSNQVNITESLSDTLALSESLLIGYGDLIAEQLPLQDVPPVVIGEYDIALFCAHLGQNWQDASLQSTATPIPVTLADTMTLSDAFGSALLGPGATEALSDTLTLSDSFSKILGVIGQISLQFAEQLILSDQSGFGTGPFGSIPFGGGASGDLVGFGILLTDAMTLSDAVIAAQVSAAILADTMSMLDAFVLVTEYDILSAEQLVMSDLLMLGYGLERSNQLVQTDQLDFVLGGGAVGVSLTDALAESDKLFLGYGLVIAEALALSDLFNFSIPGLTIQETFADSLAQIDQLDYMFQGPADAYIIADTLSLSDSVALLADLTMFGDAMSLSDALNVGYGLIVADSLTMSDAFNLVGNFGQFQLTLVDQVLMSDVGALTITAEYDLALFCSHLGQNWADAIAFPSGLIPEPFVDSLTLSDAMIFALVQAGITAVDTLVLSDSLGIGYGDLLKDQLSLADSLAALFPLSSTFTDQFTVSDQSGLGYGFLIAEQLTQSDVLSGIAYGSLITDQLAMSDAITFQLLGALISIFEFDQLLMSDSFKLGYGDSVADQLILTDQTGIGYGSLVADQLTLTDLMSFSYVLFQSLTDTMSMSDALASQIAWALGFSDTLPLTDLLRIGLGYQFTDQLTITEGPVIGFGIMLSDQMVTLTEQVGAGTGVGLNDQMAAQTDQMVFTEALLIQLSDATPAQLDAFSALVSYALQLNDAILFQEQMVMLWGMIVSGESLTLIDQLDNSLQHVVELALADSETAAWLDAILTEIVFAPSAIVLHSIEVFPELIIEALRVTKEGL